jgi:hypothetical protein
MKAGSGRTVRPLNAVSRAKRVGGSDAKVDGEMSLAGGRPCDLHRRLPQIEAGGHDFRGCGADHGADDFIVRTLPAVWTERVLGATTAWHNGRLRPGRPTVTVTQMGRRRACPRSMDRGGDK